MRAPPRPWTQAGHLTLFWNSLPVPVLTGSSTRVFDGLCVCEALVGGWRPAHGSASPRLQGSGQWGARREAGGCRYPKKSYGFEEELLTRPGGGGPLMGVGWGLREMGVVSAGGCVLRAG